MKEKLGLVLGLIVAMALPIASLSATWSLFEGRLPEDLRMTLETRVDGTIANDEEMGYTVWSGFEGKLPGEPELALKAAIDYVISNHDELEGLEVPGSWKGEDITPEHLVGATTLRFTGDDWTATVTFAPISPSVYKIEIDYNGEGGFHWKGQVDRDGNVVETAFTLTS